MGVGASVAVGGEVGMGAATEGLGLAVGTGVAVAVGEAVAGITAPPAPPTMIAGAGVGASALDVDVVQRLNATTPRRAAANPTRSAQKPTTRRFVCSSIPVPPLGSSSQA